MTGTSTPPGVLWSEPPFRAFQSNIKVWPIAQPSTEPLIPRMCVFRTSVDFEVWFEDTHGERQLTMDVLNAEVILWAADILRKEYPDATAKF